MLTHRWKYLTNIMMAERAPRHVARGVALGILVGLLPKANLICALALLLMLALRTNLAAGLMTICVASLLSPAIDIVAEPIGFAILTFGPLRPLFQWMTQLPWLPWTAFNNSAVMGNLVVSGLLGLPIYLFIKHRLGSGQVAQGVTEPTTAPPSVDPAPAPTSIRRPSRRFVIGKTSETVARA